jgi:multiple sugar transport system substrate-binding protein
LQYDITGVNTFGLVADPALFARAGVPMPDDDEWTRDDFVGLATTISTKTSGRVRGVEDPVSLEFLDLFTYQCSEHGLFTEDGEQLAITPEETAQALGLSARLTRSGASPTASMPAELSGQPDPEQTLLGRGEAATRFAWSNQLGAYRSASGNGLVLLRVPGDSTQEAPGQWLQASRLCTISARSKRREQAARPIRFLTTSTRAAEHIGADRGSRQSQWSERSSNRISTPEANGSSKTADGSAR